MIISKEMPLFLSIVPDYGVNDDSYTTYHYAT
jgi:hypothetical protein